MSAATRRRTVRRLTLRSLSQQMARLRSCVEDLQGLRDLNAAIARNQDKPGIP